MLVNQSVTRPDFIYLDLAQSYEIVDPQTYVFHIRPGVRITPNDLGVPERDMDGEDVRVNLERITQQYFAATQSTCAIFRTCRFDNGALHNIKLAADDVTPDGFHLTVSGQQKVAAVEWDVLAL